jgi:hypothetical protein
VADLPPIDCGRSSRKVVDSGIDPSDRIDGIRTIGGDPIANEEILRNGFFHPFFKLMFFFNGPTAVADFPDLVGGFIQCLTVAWNGDKNRQKENKKKHDHNIKKIDSELSTERWTKVWFFCNGTLQSRFPFIISNSL